MSQDSFGAALDAELFASEDGEQIKDAAGPDPGRAEAQEQQGGEDSGDGDDPFAALDALDAMEEEEEEQAHSPAAASAPASAPAESCSHPGFMFGLCIRCGAPKPEDEGGHAAAAGGAAGAAAGVGGNGGSGSGPVGGSGSGIPPRAAPGGGGMRIKHLHARQTLEVSAEEAARITAGAIPSLLASRRLVLVLDLDHTLLNSVREGDVSEAERPMLVEVLKRQQHATAVARAAAEGLPPPQQPDDDEQQRPQLMEASPSFRPPADPDQELPSTTANAEAAAGADAEAAADTQQQQQLPPPLPSHLGHWHPPLLYHLAHCRLWTKLRPGLREFLHVRCAAVVAGVSFRTAAVSNTLPHRPNLQNQTHDPPPPPQQDASALYELHIYTMGDKAYAREIASLLDPAGKLFVGRVVSAADRCVHGRTLIDTPCS